MAQWPGSIAVGAGSKSGMAKQARGLTQSPSLRGGHHDGMKIRPLIVRIGRIFFLFSQQIKQGFSGLHGQECWRMARAYDPTPREAPRYLAFRVIR
jgi:hypothetical protein